MKVVFINGQEKYFGKATKWNFADADRDNVYLLDKDNKELFLEIFSIHGNLYY